jgi:multiple sugar transport system permease protein
MSKLGKFFIAIIVILVLLWTLFPFYWMFITSIKSNADTYNININPFLTKNFTLEHYKYLLEKTKFLTWYKNSIIVTIIATTITIIVSLCAGYSLSRLKFRGASFWGLLIFVSYLIPPTLLFIPLSQVVSFLKVSNSIWALVITYPTFLVPFATWLLMSYFSTIPFELEESAFIDGASRIQTLVKVILPISLPAIVTVSLFSFVLSWGEMIYALVFTPSTLSKTLVVGLRTELIRGDIYYWGPLMAAALMSAIPVIIIFSFFTDLYVSGLTKGSVKY